jgi:SAM-dependent methyltransferase/glycosyltransferase involved in cell wall biosynthesis
MLDRCLKSVGRAIAPGDEVVVVDSVSKDGDAVRRAAQAAGATYVRATGPGAGRARNAGWRRATHALIVFVDDDVIVDEGWADAARRAFETWPDAGFLTGRIDVPAEQGKVERPVAIKDDLEPARIDAAFDGIIGHSANLAVRRDALERIDGFDPGMGPGTRFGGSDDLDLFDRLLAAGYVGWYAPDMRAWHDQWRTSKDIIKLDWGTGRSMGGRLAKLVRTDRQRAKRAARVLFWRWGSWDAYRWARAREWVLSVSAVARVLGGIVGLTRGLTLRLHDGFYVTDEPGAGQYGDGVEDASTEAMRAYWDRKADENAMWFIHSQLDYQNPDATEFWRSGADNLDRTLEPFDVAFTGSERVLEIGCGIGRITRALAARAGDVVGVDVADGMIAQAREQLADVANAQFVVGNGRDLSQFADASFDVVYSFIVFQHIPDPEVTYSYMREIGRVLRPGGWTVFQVSEKPEIHTAAGHPGDRALKVRLRRLLGRAPTGTYAPQWLGSSVDRPRLVEALAAGGLAIERTVGDGSQFCLVHARRR